MKTAPTNAATAGWVLVPVEPTEAMLGHGWTVATTYDDIADVERIYRAMLKAVPTPTSDEWPEIWEDPAGKGYPCFRRPMTPAEAKATIDQYAARIVELETALASTNGLTREDGIPAGMKPWAGGDAAPGDWDGGPVLFRDKTLSVQAPQWVWRWKQPPYFCDIIAYTPLPSSPAEVG